METLKTPHAHDTPPVMHPFLHLPCPPPKALDGQHESAPGADDVADKEAAAVDEYMRKAEVMGMDAQSRWVVWGGAQAGAKGGVWVVGGSAGGWAGG